MCLLTVMLVQSLGQTRIQWSQVIWQPRKLASQHSIFATSAWEACVEYTFPFAFWTLHRLLCMRSPTAHGIGQHWFVPYGHKQMHSKCRLKAKEVACLCTNTFFVPHGHKQMHQKCSLKAEDFLQLCDVLIPWQGPCGLQTHHSWGQ